ncbi:MAG: C_GCAxxG_C_C family protein [Eubacterium sp.]|nr:C_GCAxxG_C_C family protein [Eubacterium sp.]
MTKKEQAAQYHGHGNNCAQAVACAFAEDAGLPEEEVRAAVAQYGGGRKKVCGAVMGMYAAYNMKKGYVNYEDPAKWTEEQKEDLMRLEKQFLEKNRSVICKELKGALTGKPLRTCRGCVEDAAEILEDYLQGGKEYVG